MTFTNLSLIVQGIDIFYSLLTIAYASNRKINFNGDFIAGPRIISTLLRYPKLLFNLSTKTTVRTIHSKITKKAVFLRIFYRNSNECVRNPCSRVVGNHPQPFPAPWWPRRSPPPPARCPLEEGRTQSPRAVAPWCTRTSRPARL